MQSNTPVQIQIPLDIWMSQRKRKQIQAPPSFPSSSLVLGTAGFLHVCIMNDSIIVPVIIGALGTIPKTLYENIKKMESNISLHKIQDIALCGSAQILRKTIY
jgi:hypothetical protein